MQTSMIDSGLRPIVRLVALLNLAYFGIEFAVALAIGSVSLFADSVDFLEDASVNFLIFAALRWSLKHRARVGMALAGILLIPGPGGALDRLGEIERAGCPRTGASHADGRRGLHRQFYLRLHARSLLDAWGKPDPCSFPVGAE